ncbi:MAG: hypothetical protein A2283_18115 [Lentisphaerae bacterium RIFOXYA12_FULL_48_11]|nr:MAG: hypothetical protein A2283_18115 [Lentisphaerae bacterium RIFOXYA12_FULL_48_11]
MTGVLAIAFLQIRAAIRSKLFVTLMAVLFLVLVGLPLTIKGDGTFAGQIKLLLYYTLGLATIILGAATLWASSGAISLEVESRQLHLVAVKPVYHFQIWLGKFVGLLIMNIFLLCFTGLTVLGLIYWTLSFGARSDQERKVVREELLAGRRLTKPQDTLQQETRDRYNDMVAKGAIPADVMREEVLMSIKKELIADKTIVRPSAVRQWSMEIPADLGFDKSDSAGKMMLKIQFSPVRAGTNAVSGKWSVGTEEKPDIFSTETDGRMDGLYNLSIPVAADLLEAVMARPDRKMIVTFVNNDGEKSKPVMFDRINGIKLFIWESGFESNLFRALIIVLCRLSLLAAIGLTASTLFSFPVATFVSFSVLLVACMAHYFILLSEMEGHVHAGEEAKSSYWEDTSEYAMRKLDEVFEPILQVESVGPLSDGILVSWRDVGRVLMMICFYSSLIGGAGVFLFRRRELALPYT